MLFSYFLSLLIMLMLLKPPHLWKIYCKSSTKGVLISDGLPHWTLYIQCAVSNYAFRLVWFGHGFINCFALDLLLCPLPGCIYVENILDEIWKLVNLVSYISQQRGSP